MITISMIKITIIMDIMIPLLKSLVLKMIMMMDKKPGNEERLTSLGETDSAQSNTILIIPLVKLAVLRYVVY